MYFDFVFVLYFFFFDSEFISGVHVSMSWWSMEQCTVHTIYISERKKNENKIELQSTFWVSKNLVKLTQYYMRLCRMSDVY